VIFSLRAAESDKDKGGAPAKEPARVRAVLGARLGNGNEPRLSLVNDGGAAQRAGLSAGDVLVAIDGLRVTTGNLDKLLDARGAGDRLRVLAFRRDELMEFAVTLQSAPLDTVVLTLTADSTETIRERRDAWLRGSAVR
jgi:predicted metalloprotease with PDZ domain